MAQIRCDAPQGRCISVAVPNFNGRELADLLLTAEKAENQKILRASNGCDVELWIQKQITDCGLSAVDSSPVSFGGS